MKTRLLFVFLVGITVLGLTSIVILNLNLGLESVNSNEFVQDSGIKITGHSNNSWIDNNTVMFTEDLDRKKLKTDSKWVYTWVLSGEPRKYGKEADLSGGRKEIFYCGQGDSKIFLFKRYPRTLEIEKWAFLIGRDGQIIDPDKLHWHNYFNLYLETASENSSGIAVNDWYRRTRERLKCEYLSEEGMYGWEYAVSKDRLRYLIIRKKKDLSRQNYCENLGDGLPRIVDAVGRFKEIDCFGLNLDSECIDYSEYLESFLLWNCRFHPLQGANSTLDNEREAFCFPIWFISKQGNVRKDCLYLDFDRNIKREYYELFGLFPMKGALVYYQGYGETAGLYINRKNDERKLLLKGRISNGTISPDGCRLLMKHVPPLITTEDVLLYMMGIKKLMPGTTKILDVCAAIEGL